MEENTAFSTEESENIAETTAETASDKKKNVLQFIKFSLFSASAGVIQVVSFTLLSEVLVKADFFQKAMAENETFGKIMSNEYGPCYLIAIILSVIWSFTFNRKFTFKSAANIPIAMLKVIGYYAVFTPVSTIIGNKITDVYTSDIANYIVLGVTMLVNMLTEYLFDKFVVFRNQENTAPVKESKK